MIAILFSWGFCALLTSLNWLAPNSEARTDKNQSMIAIRESPYFRVPYPGQFGAPKFNAGLFFAFLVSALTSVFESVGDYHAIARVSEERKPPVCFKISYFFKKNTDLVTRNQSRNFGRRNGIICEWINWSRSWFDDSH